VNLILTGRSPINEEQQSRIKELENAGSRVFYLQADVCDVNKMQKGLNRAKERFGGISGVIHAAGVTDSQNILEKDIQNFQKVLAPKIKGTLVLDEILREEALDFICYFSSSSAILGDFGSCDYAIGNRFQTAHANYRNNQQHRGKTIVINWPLWREGGMGFRDDGDAELYLKSSGQRFLEAEEGVAVFDRLLSQNSAQHLVLIGQPSRVHRFLDLIQDQFIKSTPILSISSKQKFKLNTDKSNRENIRDYMMLFLSEELKISRDQIQLNKDVQHYGVDSIIGMKLKRDFEKYFFTEITGREMMEYRTVESLSAYLAQKMEDLKHMEKKQTFTVDLETKPQTHIEYDKEIKVLERYKKGELALEEVMELV